MPPPEILALDLMDTVVRDPFFADLPGRLGCSMDELQRRLDSSAWIAFESGVIDEPDYMERMFHPAIQPPMDGDRLRAILHDGYRFLGGMESLLDELTRHGVRLWALSNYSPWVQVMRRRLELDRFFEGYVVSYETGFRKPDPRAYAAFCQRSGVAPGRCLFVDNRQTNVEAARRTGMEALFFADAAKLRLELKAIGLL